MGKKKLTDKDYWAQQIGRVEQNGVDHIFALVRRKYAEDDIETTGPGEYIGAETIQNYSKITDQDPDSETFGKRIEDRTSPIGTKIVFKDEATPENIKKYQGMAGVNTFGKTQYIWHFPMESITAPSAKEFWKTPVEEAYRRFVLKEQVIKVETNKSHN